MARNDGTSFWARLDAAIVADKDGLPVSYVTLADITERKFREEEHNLATRLILKVNLPGDFRECMANMTTTLQGWSGCEAVGIRLREGDDFPYYETRGFPAKFVEMENHLCAYGPDGKIQRDSVGNPVHECMCGNVLCGRVDPTKPFFTAHGSFWSNNTTALLASTTDADRQTRTRNRCNGEGYESVALVPLRAGDQAFGLLQFNDHRTNRFTPELIAHFETLADSLALALSRRKAEEELRESEARFRSYFELPLHGVAITSPTDNRWLQVNDELCAILGYAREELARRTWAELTHPRRPRRGFGATAPPPGRGARALQNGEALRPQGRRSGLDGDLRGLRAESRRRPRLCRLRHGRHHHAQTGRGSVEQDRGGAAAVPRFDGRTRARDDRAEKGSERAYGAIRAQSEIQDSGMMAKDKHAVELIGQSLDVAAFADSFLLQSLRKRMEETRLGSEEEYCALLAGDAEERGRFSEALHIGYSEFFRDSLTFAVLERIVLPALLQKKRCAKHKEIRIWSTAPAPAARSHIAWPSCSKRSCAAAMPR